MDKIVPLLDNESLLIIFTFAPAGLGHLRVTDALYHGLHKADAPPLFFGSQDSTITAIHRLMSLNPVVRRVSEWAQKGVEENIVTLIYRFFLQSDTAFLYHNMVKIIGERHTRPSKILIVASHFGLAHQLAVMKQKLEKKLNIPIVLVVQVTDDSPQPIWYVSGADLIVVPSESTKRKLIEYGEKSHLPKVSFLVNAFPLSPLLNKALSLENITKRLSQANYSENTAINICIPISGAAVGTGFFLKIIQELHERSRRFIFHVVCKESPYTKEFLDKMKDLSYVKLFVAKEDRDVVGYYERVYQQTIISLELTKPSEQSFKALMDCTKKGASLLLFTEPIGRQESDNLDFLKRHALIPSELDEALLWQRISKPEKLTEEERLQWTEKASLWRGLSVPRDPLDAATHIMWYLREGIFTSMMGCKVKPSATDPHKEELQSNGVETFWEEVAKLV